MSLSVMILPLTKPQVRFTKTKPIVCRSIPLKLGFEDVAREADSQFNKKDEVLYCSNLK